MRVAHYFSFLFVACAHEEPRAELTEALPNAVASNTHVSSIDPDSGAPVANAEAAVASMRAGFRSCYNRGLASDPTMTGKVVIAIKIASDGNVLDVTKVDGAGLAADVEECIIARARKTIFDAPGGLGSTIQIPVTFVQKQ